MQVSHFVVPAEAYPRYKYTRRHAAPLFERFSAVLTKCGLADPYPKPVFGDVDIYAVVMNDDNRELVNASDLSDKEAGTIKLVSQNLHLAELQSQTENNKASIFVASYSQTLKHGNMPEIAGDFMLIIDEELRVETPECKTDDTIILTVEKGSLPKQIGLLLERMVLREFCVRLQVLDAFKNIDPPTFFANMEQDIIHAMHSRPLSSSRISNRQTPYDTVGITQKYYQTKWHMIEKKINTYYNKGLKPIRSQLMTVCKSEHVDALTVCEAIQSQIEDVTPDLDKSQRISELMPEVKRLQELSDVRQKTCLLEEGVKKHLSLLGGNIDAVENLRGEMIGMFKRSKVPDRERRTYTMPVLNEEVARLILGVHGVTGCGYRYTTLDIFFRDTLSTADRELSEDQMTAVMANNEIKSYTFRTQQANVTVYAEVGTKVTSHQNRNASLGGFVKKGKKQEDLCVLLARHFASLGKPIYVRDSNGEKKLMAHVLDPNVIVNCPLDIAVAGVLKKAQGDCQTQFRNEDGRPSKSNLVNFGGNELEHLSGMPVHFWGAASSPGLGTIITPDHFVPGMTRLVRIEDRDQQTIVRFANAGDSGAIICADDQDGDFVKVVSMLMGSPLDNVGDDERREYITLRLRDGLRQLEVEHSTPFVLC